MGLTRCGRRGGTDSGGTDAVGLTRWDFHFYALSFLCAFIFSVGLTRWDRIGGTRLMHFHFDVTFIFGGTDAVGLTRLTAFFCFRWEHTYSLKNTQILI